MALFFQLLRKYRWFSTIVVYICILYIPSIYSVDLSIEAPKKQQTSAKPDILGIETFDGLKAGSYRSYETNFGNTSYIGNYTNLRTRARDVWGGAGGKKFYPVADKGTGYQLTIKQDGLPGLNYFGLWISSFDSDNHLEFYNGGQRIYALNTQDVNKLMGRGFRYRGNPTYKFSLPIERYVFVNFFFKQLTYDEVHFTAARHRFESDNHSVGHCANKQ